MDNIVEQVFAYITQKKRDSIPVDDFAWPEARKFPIIDQRTLDAAVRLIGRAPKSKQEAIKKRIKQIAKRKGLRLPDSYQ